MSPVSPAACIVSGRVVRLFPAKADPEAPPALAGDPEVPHPDSGMEHGMNAVPRPRSSALPDGSAPRIPNGVIAVTLVVIAEAMLFAGLISAHVQFVSDQVGAFWPPLDQPPLPVAETAVGSMALLLSGCALLWARLSFRAGSRRAAAFLLAALVLGVGYLGFQGIEWVGLIRDGLDLSSAYGAFFYLIVGVHSLHTAGGLVWLARVWMRLRQGVLTPGGFMAVQVFWYFAVLIWPVIYFQVYR